MRPLEEIAIEGRNAVIFDDSAADYMSFYFNGSIKETYENRDIGMIARYLIENLPHNLEIEKVGANTLCFRGNPEWFEGINKKEPTDEVGRYGYIWIPRGIKINNEKYNEDYFIDIFAIDSDKLEDGSYQAPLALTSLGYTSDEAKQINTFLINPKAKSEEKPILRSV